MTADLDVFPFPAKAAELLRSIDTGAVLGASRQLNVLGDALVDVATVRADEPEALRANVAGLVDHVTLTRGASSQAVINGLELMTHPVLSAPDSRALGPERGHSLLKSVRAFRQELDGWLASVRRQGHELLGAHRFILAYDYSSTVAQVLADVSLAGRDLTVFVPEARSLDGGRKYLADWNDLHVQVRLIPDAALGWALSQCDAAVVGAETLSADGGCYNTIGTAVVAHEARRTGIPFYVLSILLKTDLRTDGGERLSPSLDFLQQLETSLPSTAKLSVQGVFPDLDYTDPTEITGVVTECGLLSPEQVRGLASAASGHRETLDG